MWDSPEYCVSSTANDASDFGFKTHYIKNCTREWNSDDILKAKGKMKKYGIIEVNSNEYQVCNIKSKKKMFVVFFCLHINKF